MTTLNEFSGMSTKTLEARLKRLTSSLDAIDNDEDAGGGGSPREGLLDRIDDLEIELRRRKSPVDRGN